MELEYIFRSAIVTTIVAFILAFPIINLLYRLKIVRQINVDFSVLIESRKHKYGTPIMGGLIVIVSVLLINVLTNFSHLTSTPLLLFLAFAVLGGLDDFLNIYGKKRKKRTVERIVKLIRVHKDRVQKFKYALFLPWYAFKRMIGIFESNPGKGLLAGEKILVQLILAMSFSYWVYNSGFFAHPEELWLPIFGVINISFLMVPFIWTAILGMTNAVNFSDGMDGLSAGMLINSFGALLVIAIVQENFELAVINATVVGALITYLYFNIPPARVQMGDVGTFALGALFAIMGFMQNIPVLLPVIGLPFVIEVSSTILQSLVRRVFGRRLFKMAPIHHHFEMSGWSEEKVVMRFWLFSSLCSFVGIWFYFL